MAVSNDPPVPDRMPSPQELARWQWARELEGRLARLEEIVAPLRQDYDTRLAREAELDVEIGEIGRGEVLLREVAAVVCRHFGVRLQQLRGDGRRQGLAVPRMVYTHLARRATGRSYPQIGKYINRDHSTILHHIRQPRPGVIETARDLYQQHFAERKRERPDAEAGTENMEAMK